MILSDDPIARLDKSEDALQNAKRMFNLLSNSRLSRVLALGFLVYIASELRAYP
jgi:hypothetical protein